MESEGRNVPSPSQLMVRFLARFQET